MNERFCDKLAAYLPTQQFQNPSPSLLRRFVEPVMLRRHGLLLSVVLVGGLLPGCASFGIKNGIPYFSKQDQWEPEVEEDKWKSVGEIGRGNRQLEDERDPLKPMLMSKEAQDIERNLGYK